MSDTGLSMCRSFFSPCSSRGDHKECPVYHRQFFIDYAMKKHLKNAMMNVLVLDQVAAGRSWYFFQASGHTCWSMLTQWASFPVILVVSSTLQERHKYFIQVTQSSFFYGGEQNCPYHSCSKVFTNPESRQDHMAYYVHDLDYRGPFKCLFQCWE